MMFFLCDFHLQSKIGVMFDFFVRSSLESKRIFLFLFEMVENVYEFRFNNPYVSSSMIIPIIVIIKI